MFGLPGLQRNRRLARPALCAALLALVLATSSAHSSFVPAVPSLPESQPVSAAVQGIDQAIGIVKAAAPQAADSQLLSNLDLAKAIIQLHENGPHDLASSIAIAKLATAWQAKTLGMVMPDSFATPHQATPSEAALALAGRHGITPVGADLDAIRALDSLPAQKAHALVAMFDGFMGLEDATQLAYAHADMPKLRELTNSPSSMSGPASAPPFDLKSLGVDFGPIFAARNQFLEASLTFSKAWPIVPSAPQSSPAPPGINECPAFALDLDGVDTQYTAFCRMTLDVGGDDKYLNNAGGSRVVAGDCGGNGSGALVDLTGDDAYASNQSCGINGGGYLGSGFLLDSGGNDHYVGGGLGINGGARSGVGFILDQNGQDTYNATFDQTNGGGGGILLDAGGNDAYVATNSATNGGGGGLLLDLMGEDTYTATDTNTNGGGGGFLMDLAGKDTYSGGKNSVNGGSGFLLDQSGNDSYLADGNAANGGGHFGTGFLLDEAGNDDYIAGDGETNGGANEGSGFLIDLIGNDLYSAGSSYTNGYATTGIGLLFDGGGSDQYNDLNGGTGIDKTVLPKGFVGAQLDCIFPPTLVPTPTQLAVLCGTAINNPCPQGADLSRIGACGLGPLCPAGLVGTPGPNQLAVLCGVPVTNPCPNPVGTPGPNQLAVVCGQPVPNPCPTPVGTPGPGQLVVICGQPVPDPCTQGVDPIHLAACGLGPLCPTGLIGTPGPDQLAVLCGIPVSNPCPTPLGPAGPGQLATLCGMPVPNPLPGVGPQCSDGLDNDGDGFVDFAPMQLRGQPYPGQPGKIWGDPDCTNELDISESP